MREYKKEKLYGRKNKWIYYESLMFLKDRFKYKNPGMNGQNEHDYYEAEVPEKGLKSDEKSTDLEAICAELENRARPTKRLKTKASNQTSASGSKSSEVSSSAGQNINDAEEMDPDYYFLMSLLPYMKSVRPERKMDVRMRLQQVFCDEQQQNVQTAQPPSCNPCSSTSPNGQYHVLTTPSVDSQSELSSYISSFNAEK